MSKFKTYNMFTHGDIIVKNRTYARSTFKLLLFYKIYYD